MDVEEDAVEKLKGVRQFKSPNRILVRSFRLSRDRWKEKHHRLQAELEQTRQLVAERGAARDEWRARCEAAQQREAVAETLAAKQHGELEQLQAQVEQLQAELKKNAVSSGCWGVRGRTAGA